MVSKDSIKQTVAENIVFLRTSHNMTQLELAEQLHYTDKAVSKWERAESIPDVTVLIQIAQFFEVPLQYLVEPRSEKEHRVPLTQIIKNRKLIIGISLAGVILIALLIFNLLEWIFDSSRMHYLSYIFAVPVMMTVWLILNSVWFHGRRNWLILSLLMWTLLAAVFVAFLFCGKNLWLLFLLGIPGEIIIILTSRIRYTRKQQRE